MSTWYIDGGSGNDGNAGTSTGTALLTLRGLAGKGIATLDIIRIKGGYTYTYQPTSTTDTIISGLTTVGDTIFVMGWVGDTQDWVISATKDTANPTYTGGLTAASKVYVSGGRVDSDVSGTTNTVAPFRFSTNSGSGSNHVLLMDGTKEYWTKTGNATTVHVAALRNGGANSTIISNNCKVVCSGGYFSLIRAQMNNCYGVIPANSTTQAIAVFNNNRFKVTYHASTGMLFLTGANNAIRNNNTLLLDMSAGTFTNCMVFSAALSDEAVSQLDVNNLMVATGIGSGSLYAYRAASSITFTAGIMAGYNSYNSFTAVTNNISGPYEFLGGTLTGTLTSSVFKSTDPDNADFLIVDETVTNVNTYIRELGLNGTDIGARKLSNGLPVEADVKTGVIYDNGRKTGTLVSSGVSFDRKMVNKALGIS